MSDTLKNILEKYRAAGGDEQRFADKHTDNVQVTDGPGAKEASKAGKSTKKKKDERHGYEPGEDEEVYESSVFNIEDLRSVLSEKEMDESLIEEIEKELVEAKDTTDYFNLIDDAINTFIEEASEEERAVVQEMISTEEGYQELLDFIFEEDDEDEEDDDDDDEDDEDDDEEEYKAEVEVKTKK